MSYLRVIPRDLFNEANLLKCFGRLYINLETANLPGVGLEHDHEAFNIDQDENSGAIFLTNVTLLVNGHEIRLECPMNSRSPWPLQIIGKDDEVIEVFNADGSFSVEANQFLAMMSSIEREPGDIA